MIAAAGTPHMLLSTELVLGSAAGLHPLVACAAFKGICTCVLLYSEQHVQRVAGIFAAASTARI